MVQTPAKLLTLEEFLQLPETEPANEYGEVVFAKFQEKIRLIAEKSAESDFSRDVEKGIGSRWLIANQSFELKMICVL